MVTPQEIELKEFSRSIKGYDRDEVDEFLDLIILDLQDLLAGMDALKKENEELKVEIEDHKKSQKKVMDTLESAKKLMKDISDSAEKRADIIIQNAKMDAEQILNNAKAQVPGYVDTTDGTELRDKLLLFKSKYRQLLEDELENLDSKSDDLLSELEKEFIPVAVDTQVVDFSDLNAGAYSAPSVVDDGESLKDADELIRQLENDAKEIADKSNIDNSPLAKDTVVLDAHAIDELINNK